MSPGVRQVKEGVSKDKILIKVASTWEGIKAAEQLEKEGTKCKTCNISWWSVCWC